ncbi:hypothetical protein ACFE04_023148 [Oxalis oulophora]
MWSPENVRMRHGKQKLVPAQGSSNNGDQALNMHNSLSLTLEDLSSVENKYSKLSDKNHDDTVQVPLCEKAIWPKIRSLEPQFQNSINYTSDQLLHHHESSNETTFKYFVIAVPQEASGNIGCHSNHQGNNVILKAEQSNIVDNEIKNLTTQSYSEIGKKRIKTSGRSADLVEQIKQRRRIKNRESKARSMARKQAHTLELASELEKYKEENIKLKEILANADASKQVKFNPFYLPI